MKLIIRAFSLFLLQLISDYSFAQLPNTWSQIATFSGTARSYSVGFGIGNRGYVGTGADNWNNKKDFWEYDPNTNQWTQKADYGGGECNQGIGFSIGSKGYLGIAGNKQFWEYNPATNQWTQKANYPGMAKRNAVGFAVGSKGYVGTGKDSIGGFTNDFWEYNPSTDSWTQKTNFPGVAREDAIGFSILDKGYLGLGDTYPNLPPYSDFWEYNPVADSWIQKSDFAGPPRLWAVGFNILDLGYVGTGYYQNVFSDFWEYNSTSNTWTQKASIGGAQRCEAVGFSIGSEGFIGLGHLGIGSPDPAFGDFWKYTIGSSDVLEVNFENEIFISPNPATTEIKITNLSPTENQISIFNLLGQQVLYRVSNVQSTTIPVSDLPAGIYVVTLFDGEKIVCKKFVKE